MMNTDRHPCFNVKVKGECGRVHLPVAPKCNIMCNYCNRKYDCVNESRPGVTSAVLKPKQAIAYLEQVLEKEPRITVAGIAGPGDPFANPKETLETIRLIRQRFPELLMCLATNGLGLPPYLDELAELKVSHVTLTVNAVDPEIGAKIYSWVRDGKVIYRGLKAAEVLLERQLESIARPQGPGDYGQDQHHHHPRGQRPPRPGGGQKDGGTGGGYPQLHAHVSQCRYALRGRAGTAAGTDDRNPPGGREDYPPDAPLHPLPGRRGGTAGGRPHR